jgi:hypothetical protein
MQIPCVYLPGPAPAVSVANTKHITSSAIKFSKNDVHCSETHQLQKRCGVVGSCGELWGVHGITTANKFKELAHGNQVGLKVVSGDRSSFRDVSEG